ncbi:LOW QUALITY PROTEIN: hypothetical protein OSB04_020319 [Centaurea solstitialis]|uniref:Integrase catalytic domain-containing protein n=1 Tax=Centaurea solstitialis TaxID=347529 RepID=A0AA38WGQ0_9ASTR|nr:LOW QUALITY PROTEIN: hypothetical protein OSB04_020319 [Centaurea solstitialis]
MDPKTHPAITVTNIKKFIPFTLEMESGQYTSWAKLFRIHCRTFQVANHINSSAAPPRSTPSSSIATEADKTKAASEFEAWSRLDAIVLQWIYSTISNDLLHTILKPNTTASQAWTALENIFQDNRNTRAIYLDSKFVSTRLDQHPNVSSYCQAMKMIADQLANVGNPVNNQRLVLQLIAGLNDNYEGVAMLIQQTNPLPDFYEPARLIKLPPPLFLPITPPPPAPLQPPPRLLTIHVAVDMAVAAPPADEDATTTPNNRHMVGDPLRTSHGHLFRLLGLTQIRLNGHIHHANTRPSSPTSARPLLHLLEFWAIIHNKLMRYTPTDLEQAFHTMAIHPPDQTWYADTGATSHMTNNSGNFTSYVNNGLFRNVIVGDGSPIPIRGIGHQTLLYPFPPLLLKNVLHTPRIIKNLLSIRRFTIDNNVSVEFDPFGIPNADTHSVAIVLAISTRSITHPSTFAAITRDLWHHRLGHPGADVLSTLRSNLRFSSSKHLSSNTFCHSCVLGKQIKFPFSSSNSLTHLPFDIIHTDVWTSPVLSSSGHRYYVLFLDDKTNYLWTYPLANKSQVFSTFLHFFSMIKTQFHYTIKTIQCDNGREFDNQQFHNLCSQIGTQFRFSCPTPHPKMVKRSIRSINNILRTLLAHSNVPMYLWHHALQHATYLLNILPTKTLANLTPTRLLYNLQPTYTHLRTFGCLCYPLTPSLSIHKLQKRSQPCVSLCYDINSKTIILSRHVVFDETNFPFSQSSSPPKTAPPPLSSDPHPLLWSGSTPSVATIPPPTPTATTTQTALPPPSLQTYSHRSRQAPPPPSVAPPLPTTAATLVPPSPTPPVSSTRTIHTRSMSGISKPRQPLNLHNSTSISPLPRNPLDALKNPDWNKAMTDEFRALIDNNTWELVPRTHDMNIVRSMWIFRHKTNSDGSLERYKARLVCDGRSQKEGIDCGDTFSPVVKPATIRTVLSIALSNAWEVHQLDVKNAFLHGHFHETVYMHQPPGFRDQHLPNHVCLLKKSLYGLKQAPRAWYQRFADYVFTLGFKHSKCDHSLFVYKNGKQTAFLLLYVDDILLITSSPTLRQDFMALLAKEFAMKHLGPLSYFLGISQYAKEILDRAGMSSCHPSATPVDIKAKLSSTDGDLLTDGGTQYRQLVGALQYLTFTRPDISYAVQQICMHMHAPRTSHFNALKRILRYIKGMLDHGLHLTKSPRNKLIAYTDADWAGCPDTRRSTSGYCVYLGDNLISWSSKRQPAISRSSVEAEYRGVANVVSETCWIRNLLLELHIPTSTATLVYCDNVNAVYLSCNPVQHQRTKHIEIDIHFVREQVAHGQVRVSHIPSRYQVADIFTKGLPLVLFTDFKNSLNIRPPTVSTAGVY